MPDCNDMFFSQNSQFEIDHAPIKRRTYAVFSVGGRYNIWSNRTLARTSQDI